MAATIVSKGLAAVVGLCAGVANAADDAAAWNALLSGGHVVMMRHAIAPGTGDPDSFRLGECATQRNLSAQGREQAMRIGRRLRENGVTSARVYSSQWCRTLETAKLLGFGPVTELPPLNSFFERGDRGEQTQALRQWLAKQNLEQPVVLVTHQVNITAASGVFPASGEMVVLRRAEHGVLKVVGTIRTE